MLVAKTLFVIVFSTARVVFPDLSPGVEGVPAAKSVSIELFSDMAAPAGATATAAVPAGLKLGSTVKLEFSQDGLVTGDSSATAGPEVTTKTYWCSSEKVLEGQPRVVKSASLSAPPTGYPTKTYASWPGLFDDPIKDDATAQGTYKLTTSSLGSTAVQARDGFLPAIELVQPPGTVNLAKSIKVEWKPVPGAVGYIVTAYGGTDKESIDWTSSSDPAKSADIDTVPVTAADVVKLVEAKVLMPPDATKCTIPAGIFAGSDSVVLTVTAVGRDSTQLRDGIESRVIVRSALSMPVHTTRAKFD